jgi:outer membrane biosynthesis protein TonB
MRCLPPLILSSFFAFSVFGPVAQSQALPASEVTSMLAKSQALDSKCNILSEGDRQDLMDFVARAEIIMAEKQSVKAARSAISKGKSEAAALACGPERAKFVGDILAAARAGSAMEEPAQQTAEPTVLETAKPVPVETVQPTPKPVIKPKQKPVVAAKPIASDSKPRTKTAGAKPAKKNPEIVKTVAVEQKQKPKLADANAAKPKKKQASDLNNYAGLAQRYYVELRCRNLSGAAVKRLYSNVLASHRQALAQNGPGAVRAALRNAEARANASRCT